MFRGQNLFIWCGYHPMSFVSQDRADKGLDQRVLPTLQGRALGLEKRADEKRMIRQFSRADISGIVSAAFVLNVAFTIIASLMVVALSTPAGMLLNSTSLGSLLLYVPAMLLASLVRNFTMPLPGEISYPRGVLDGRGTFSGSAISCLDLVADAYVR